MRVLFVLIPILFAFIAVFALVLQYKRSQSPVIKLVREHGRLQAHAEHLRTEGKYLEADSYQAAADTVLEALNNLNESKRRELGN